MSYYPDGKFITEFSKRTADNLRQIDKQMPLNFSDTALISALLAVFVLPEERGEKSDLFMAEILRGYHGGRLEDVIEVVRRTPSRPDGEPEEMDLPKSLDGVPVFLRHAIAHLNIRPERRRGSDLTHLLVWNRKGGGGPINFVARVDLKALKPLALHILDQLAVRRIGDSYNGIDPIAEFDRAQENVA